jgi:hypothetical protein
MGICPFNPDVLPETVFAPSSVSQRPIHSNINRRQETPSGINNQDISALDCSTPVCRSVREMLPSKTDWKPNALRLFPNVNATLTTKDLFKSKLGKTQKLNTKE